MKTGAQTEITIGILTDLTGQVAYFGRAAELGARLAQKDLAEEGKKIRLVIGDSKLDTKAGLSEARKMLSSDNVDAIYALFTQVVAAISPVVAAEKRLLVGGSVGTSFLRTNPYAVKTYLDYQKGCRLLAESWKEKGLTKIGILHVPFESSEVCLKGAKEVYPDLYEETFDPGAMLNEQVLRLKRKQAQAILIVGYEADGINLAKTLRTLHYSPSIGAAEQDIAVEANIEKYRDLLGYITVFGLVHLPLEFEQRIRREDPAAAPAGYTEAAEAYIAIKQLAAAINGCAHRDVECQIRKLEASPPDRLMSFEGYKNRVADYRLELRTF